MTKKLTRQQVLDKCNGNCAYCGTKLELKAMQVDHIIPKDNFINWTRFKINVPSWLEHLGEGDLNHPDNLLPSCRSCNYYKSSNSLDWFRKEIKAQPERLRSRVFTFKLAERFGLIQEIETEVKFYFEEI